MCNTIPVVKALVLEMNDKVFVQVLLLQVQLLKYVEQLSLPESLRFLKLSLSHVHCHFLFLNIPSLPSRILCAVMYDGSLFQDVFWILVHHHHPIYMQWCRD
jgi:hypothetical protein